MPTMRKTERYQDVVLLATDAPFANRRPTLHSRKPLGLIGAPVWVALCLVALLSGPVLGQSDPTTSGAHESNVAAAGVAGGPTIGPDVIVGKLGLVRRFGRVDGITGYSVATTGCSVGDAALDWIAASSFHPVIAQNMYRLRDGAFEQIGMSWLKHSFAIDNQEFCSGPGGCTPDDSVERLAVGCSDTYLSHLNGSQALMGPRFEVNAATGEFPWPHFARGEIGDPIFKRMQIRDEDLDPTLNAAALYFVEGHYVTLDDAQSDNRDNNASYKEVTLSEIAQNEFQFFEAAETVTETPAIFAWQQHDPQVTIVTVDVPGDGRIFLGYKVTPLPDLRWRYEYAIHNLNSDRAVGSFSVPVPPGVQLRKIGFHDIDSHSGSPLDSTDWDVTIDRCTPPGSVTWSTTGFSANPNANALRWGRLFNFRFDAISEPIAGNVELGLFKFGDPAVMSVPAAVPSNVDVVLLLLGSDPPDGAIDARQPTDLNGVNPIGWQEVDLSFNVCIPSLTANDFTITQQGGTLPAPGVKSIVQVENENGATVTVRFDRSIEPGAWTTIDHPAGGPGVRLGYLPGDVNGDRTSAPADILAVIDCLNGSANFNCDLWQTDVDRSGEAGPADILRVIDLLNGAGQFNPWLNRTLP